jgi:hypothetical protein
MKKPRVIQTHHISYEPPVTVRVYQGEHFVLTQLQRRKHISKGFIKAMRVWADLNEDGAVFLEKEGA